MNEIKLFVDDIRTAGMVYPGEESSWTTARTVTEAIHLLSTQNVVEVSLDHDICHATGGTPGAFCTCPEDYSAVAWFIAFVPFGVKRVVIHTDNPAGAEKMKNIFETVKGHQIKIERRAASTVRHGT